MGLCPNCGHENPEIAKFCEKCGTGLASAPTAEPDWDPGKTIQSPKSIRTLRAEAGKADVDQPTVQTSLAKPPEQVEESASQPTVIRPAVAPQPGGSPEAPPPSAKRRSRLPLILGGIAALLVICCVVLAIVLWRTGFDVGGLSLGSVGGASAGWAGRSVPAVLDLDLRSLTFSKQTEVDAKESFGFEKASMSAGRIDIYAAEGAKNNAVAAITALWYADSATAGQDFQTFLDEANNLGADTKTINTVARTGAALFEFADTFDRLEWSGNWILHVSVVKGQTSDAPGTRDRIWDKWQEYLKTVK